jgi:hypothetical protein
LAEPLILFTVRIAVVLYAAAILVSLLGGERRSAAARVLWSSSLAAYLVHVLAAFHFVHGWSHRRAALATARQTGEMVGVASEAGLWLNYLFTAVFAADVVWWWADPAGYARRPLWLAGSVHGFLAFMFFNGTVVFGSGPARALGIAATLALLLALIAAPRRAGP